MKEISILGSTGSVGRQTLEVARHNPDEFKVVGIASRFSRDILIEQIREFSPRVVSVLNSEEKEKLEEMTNDLKIKPEIVCGLPGLIKVSTMPEVKMVVVAVVGLVGLVPTLKAIEYRKDIALATKEVMVIAGKIVKQALKKFKVNLIPIDSEHSAIFQCLKGEAPDHIKKIILTCSGGPFRQKTREELKKVTVREALRHPNWKMGQKITIASATLMNKGLEILEAKWLFDVKLEQIEVIIHPQSIIHSMVEFKDGNVTALLSSPDMRYPIQYALSFPRRLKNGLARRLNLAKVGQLTYEKPDVRRFPCLSLAIQAGKLGGTMPAVLVAADEVAVEKFTQGKLAFNRIPEIIRKTMGSHRIIKNPSLSQILVADNWARRRAAELI